MSNKTNIKKDIIKRLKSLSKALKQNLLESFILSKESREILANDIENILADRENYKALYKRALNDLVKAETKENKYDIVEEKIKEILKKLDNEKIKLTDNISNSEYSDSILHLAFAYIDIQKETLQELLDKD